MMAFEEMLGQLLDLEREILKSYADRAVALPPVERAIRLGRMIFLRHRAIKQIFDEIPFGFFLKDYSNGNRFVFWNHTCAQLFQLPAEAVLGKTSAELFQDHDGVKQIEQMDDLVIRTRRTLDLPSLKLTLNHRPMLFRIKKFPIALPFIDHLLIGGILEDITEQVAQEQALLDAHRSRENLEKIIQTSPIVLFLFNDDPGLSVHFSSHNFTQLGWSDDLAHREKSLQMLLGDENAQTIHAALGRLNRGEGEVFVKLYLLHGRWVEGKITKDTSPFAQHSYQAIFWDITNLIQTHEELKQAKHAADNANRAKGQFLASVSHELRTPLNGILGMTEIILGSQLDADQISNLQVVRASAENLLRIINDILDYSKIEAGKMQMEWVETNLRHVLNQAIAALEPLANKKGLSMSLKYENGCPETLFSDPLRIHQVIHNLVGNAIKFTSKGGVKIRVRHVTSTSPDGEAIEIRVVDSGIGIPQDKLEAIFEAFTQSDPSITRRFGGTGLGLSIAKNIVNLLGGHIHLSSINGLGTAFTFSLPLHPPQATQLSRRQKTPLDLALLNEASLHVLLAEDNQINRLVAARMFEKAGWTFVLVENGQEALDQLKEHTFDLVFLDIQMPVMDGLTAKEIIRQNEEGCFDSEIPLVAMTAHSMKSEIDHLLANGFDGYLPKPYKKEELMQITQEVLAKKLQDSPGGSS
jgi:signal transduction histidine kinase/CheY-like chemotaxis protein